MPLFILQVPPPPLSPTLFSVLEKVSSKEDKIKNVWPQPFLITFIHTPLSRKQFFGDSNSYLSTYFNAEEAPSGTIRTKRRDKGGRGGSQSEEFGSRSKRLLSFCHA